MRVTATRSGGSWGVHAHQVGSGSAHQVGPRQELSTLLARTQGGYELDVTTLLCLANDADVELAAEALVEGLPVAAGFANFYVLYTRPDAATARAELRRLLPASAVGGGSGAPASRSACSATRWNGGSPGDPPRRLFRATGPHCQFRDGPEGTCPTE